MRTHVVYFSATYTTRTICERIAGHLSEENIAYDVTNDESLEDISIPEEDLLVIGIPVYAGRIPEIAVDRLNRFKGKGTKAIAVAVYGNRDYEDALIELTDLVQANGFQVIGAGAFIARHCIFTELASNRPDEQDMEVIRRFAEQCQTILSSTAQLPMIEVKGNRPYKPNGHASARPTSDETCNHCGKCARLCPTHAISLEQPPLTDNDKCLACGRCLVVCPTGSRNFRGEKYQEMAIKFTTSFSARREPELFFASV
ncbi:MAG: 4Fe-4S dicluster domain-containing protein [Bacteroides sp.]|nr:4Fe-4S dicluster domain-containing protein [Bacteroides sp.]